MTGRNDPDPREPRRPQTPLEANTRLAESEARIRELEAALAKAKQPPEVGEADDQQVIDRLVEENRRLAAQIEAMPGDLSALHDAAEEAKARLEVVRAETERRVRAELADQISATQSERESLQAQLNMAMKQLGAEGKSPVVPADRVADMLKGLVDRMQVGLEGLRIHEGEVKLRVGIEAVGDGVGFVIPSADSTPELRENLQEVTFRFDRRTA